MADDVATSPVKPFGAVREIAAAADCRVALARREAGGLQVFETRLLRQSGEAPATPRLLPPPILRTNLTGRPR